jgi:YD repeat-containing protein
MDQSYELKMADGSVMRFSPFAEPYSSTEDVCQFNYGFDPETWVWPQDVSLNFVASQGVVSKVTSSLGRTLNVSGPVLDSVKDEAGALIRFGWRAPADASSSQRPLGYSLLERVYAPEYDTQPATTRDQLSLEYAYDGQNRVREGRDAAALQQPGIRSGHAFIYANGAKGVRTDPLGGRFKVDYDDRGRAERFTDEIGRMVTARYDGRDRVVERVYPEQDRETFAYDARGNPTRLTKVAKPGSGLDPIEVRAEWHPEFNKPVQIEDGSGRRTDLDYDGRGLLWRVQRPQPEPGAGRPTYHFEYDGIGLVTREADPTGRVTTHVNSPEGDRTLTTVAAVPVNGPSLNLTTEYRYTPKGDQKAIIDPRGAATTRQFDAMRRPDRRTAEKRRRDRTSAGREGVPL